MVFVLPKLQARLPIVDNNGHPASFFLRFFNMDFSGAIERQEATQQQILEDIIAINERQDETDQSLQDQIDRLTRVLAGEEEFSGLNVGGTDVKPFLDRTDGSMITDSAALDDGLITTGKVAVNAITAEASAFTAASLDVTGTSEVTVQTVNYTTTGQTIEARANFYLTLWHPTAGNMNVTVRMYRDATLIYSQLFEAINGDLLQGWMTPAVVEEPAAGTYTYTTTVQVDVSNTNEATATSRLLAVREYKR